MKVTKRKPRTKKVELKPEQVSPAPKKPKVSEEEKALRELGKKASMVHLYNALFNPKVNVDKLVNDQTLTPYERGAAKFAVRFMEQGSSYDLQLVMNIFGNPTKASEMKIDDEGSYLDFLRRLTGNNE